MVADTVWTDCGVKRTGSEPYFSTRARLEAWLLVKGAAVDPLITAVPLKEAASMAGADSTTPSSSKASRALGRRVAGVLLVVGVALGGDLVELRRRRRW